MKRVFVVLTFVAAASMTLASENNNVNGNETKLTLIVSKGKPTCSVPSQVAVNSQCGEANQAKLLQLMQEFSFKAQAMGFGAPEFVVD